MPHFNHIHSIIKYVYNRQSCILYINIHYICMCMYTYSAYIHCICAIYMQCVIVYTIYYLNYNVVMHYVAYIVLDATIILYFIYIIEEAMILISIFSIKFITPFSRVQINERGGGE